MNNQWTTGAEHVDGKKRMRVVRKISQDWNRFCIFVGGKKSIRDKDFSGALINGLKFKVTMF